MHKHFARLLMMILRVYKAERMKDCTKGHITEDGFGRGTCSLLPYRWAHNSGKSYIACGKMTDTQNPLEYNCDFEIEKILSTFL